MILFAIATCNTVKDRITIHREADSILIGKVSSRHLGAVYNDHNFSFTYPFEQLHSIRVVGTIDAQKGRIKNSFPQVERK